MRHLYGVAQALSCVLVHIANAATYVNFGTDLSLRPDIINDNGMRVAVEMEFNLDRNAEGNHPQKFYFVPDNPPRAEPRLVVLQSSGQLRLYQSLSSGGNNFVEFLNIIPDVFWDGFHSMAFDPNWPASPYIYIYYIGYTNIDQSKGGYYPNTTLKGGRPINFNTPGYFNRGGCWLVDDKTNYNNVMNICPNYRTSVTGCSPISFLCEMFSRVDRVRLDVNTFQVQSRTPIYGSLLTCGGYWGHHWSNIMFLSDKSMVFGMGDHSIDSVAADPGDPLGDMCYNTAEGAPQGHWRPQRDFTDIGKFLRVFPGKYQTATGPMQRGTDYEIIARGVRNPYSTHVMPDDSIWVGDVGNGEAERIFHFSAKGSAGNVPSYNMGWPCLEGEIGVLLESSSEQQRAQYLKNNNFKVCDPIYKAAGVATNYYVGNPATTVADPNYFRPTFEFREFVDPDYEGCRGTRAAISGIIFNSGEAVGLRYRDKVFFSDHSKRCLFYGEVGADGKLTNVRALMEKGDVGISHLLMHPVDGRLLMLDYEHSRIISLSGGANDGLTPGVDDPNTISTPPVGAPAVNKLQPTCVNGAADNLSTFNWIDTGLGYYEGVLELGAVQYTNEYGETRTRGFNGKLPGPIIRMQSCKIYKLRVTNTLVGWTNTVGGALNSFHAPMITNLHTHGLHISGMGDADNITRQIMPGQSAIYTYAIPCDHAGGTHFYHPHHHGGVTISAGAGAVGLLVVEDNPFHENVPSRPSIYSTFPTHHLVFEYMDPAFSKSVAFTSGDEVYDTTATVAHYLTNGCTSYQMSVTLGRWTRLRMLYVGRMSNAAISIRVPSTGELACTSALLAKDGIYASPAGRVIPSEYFFSVSSRADVAVYCATAGTYNIEIETAGATGRKILGKIVVPAGVAVDAATLVQWTPCRPHYLEDLQTQMPTGAGLAVVLTEGEINGRLFSDSDNDVIATIAEGQILEWTITGSDLHPFHMHVNHVQLQGSFNWDMVPGWYQAGDWVDTISVPQTSAIRFRADRYGGNMVLHCHVYEHSDAGMIRRALITGGSGEYNIDISIKNPATCSIAPACPADPTGMPWCPGGGPTFPTSDPTCSAGIIHSNGESCCSINCENCGGVNCAASAGGAANCCASAISTNGRSCNSTTAPCTISDQPPVGDPTCAYGIKHYNGVACCAPTCEDCGGVNCASSTGGAASCCNSGISTSGRSCNAFMAPCMIGATTAPTTAPPATAPPTTAPPATGGDPTCALGKKHADGVSCCSAKCENCGGTTCATSTGGATNCCASSISTSGKSCNTNQPPCIISAQTPPATSDPTCKTGIIHPNKIACCSAGCQDCGGVTCAQSTGGAASCCNSGISTSGRSCNTTTPPCMMSARRAFSIDDDGEINEIF